MTEPLDALGLFRRMAGEVPAYAAFLAERDVDAASVTALAQVPLLTKENYHQRYPLAERCWGGSLRGIETVAVSSGSSGRPTVWPRRLADELVVTERFEQVLVDGLGAGGRSTLAVVCFALGSWVGGMYTAAACRHLATQGHPVTVATPGNDVAEILRVVGELGPIFDQVVLLGYPPFVKNVVDAGLAQGVDWAAYDVGIVLAGEVFSEEWRDLVCRRAGGIDPVTRVAALYGTADAGVLGNETPLSVRIRRFLASTPDLAREVFGDPRLPTLVQHDPGRRLFEDVEGGTLAFTADGAVPMVRYHIADVGRVLGKESLVDLCREHGFDPGDGPDLPFVFVFGRSLFTVSFFGANVYPENVTVGLERPRVADRVTGRFVVRSVEDDDRDRRLQVVVELAPGVDATDTLTAEVADSVLAELLRLNSEYAHYVPTERQRPDVLLRPLGDPEFFPPGVKHRYSRP